MTLAALRAEPMGKLGIGSIANKSFERLPRIVVVTNFFTKAANRKKAFQDVDSLG
jgi:hypothetical protein